MPTEGATRNVIVPGSAEAMWEESKNVIACLPLEMGREPNSRLSLAGLA
jgi:hypothetical protein